MKHGGSVPERILQLLQGLIVDAIHAIVDKGAAQEHSQGKYPQVTPGVLLECMLETLFRMLSFRCSFTITAVL